MKRAAVLFLAFSALSCATAPPRPPAAAPATKPDEAILGAIAQLSEGVAQQPTNTPWIYILAQYHDRAHDAENAAKWLSRLDELGWVHGAAPHDFRNTGAHPNVRAALAKLEAREPRHNRARAAFKLANQRDLIPEGITHDPVDDVFYVTSIYRRKVVRIDRKGRVTDFTSEAQDGMLSGLGVHVDAQRRLLWVASSTAPEMRGFSPELEGQSVLLAYDLRDGKLVRRIAQGSKEAPSFLNDFAILPDGTLLITDTVRNQVARLAPEATALEEWLPGFAFPNGIVVDANAQSVYVADFRGLTRVTLDGKATQKIESQSLLNGIDGLTMHRGLLVGIQNAIGKARVIRVDPASGQVEVLESKNAAFELPTTGVVAGDELWFIANPGLRSFTAGAIWPIAKLADPLLLRLPL
ncbi:MAG TPA: SMP-30/gluconolactonase/LRE family protein [Thermoanaerobaculia bacterium]